MTTKNLTASIWRNPIHFIACGFGSGAAPLMPGTAGTVAAIPLYLLLRHLSLTHYCLMLIVVTLFGIWVCGKTARDFQVHDHPSIVWDEIAGYLITMFAAPAGWVWIILGFGLFRFFDILKPWPIRAIDTHVKGGTGIMLDDVLAAVYAWLILQGIAWISLP